MTARVVMYHFYYSDTPSFREHFGKFADKYGFKGAFSGMMHRFSTRNEHWGYVLHCDHDDELHRHNIFRDADNRMYRDNSVYCRI